MMPTLTAALAPGAESAGTDVPRFGVFEAALAASGDHANPYAAVTASAVLTPPGGGPGRTIPLFWDGGKTWRLRFSPDVEGEWRWTVRSSDAGLDGSGGAFRCVPSKRRGSVRAMAGHPRHFAWQDGTPFWWLGDTAWALYTNSEKEQHDRAAVFRYLDVRARQGFNVVHSMLISEADWNNDGGMPFSDLAGEAINPVYWREVDARVRHLAERGMVAGLVLAWTDKGESKQSWQHFPSDEARLRYARYIVARYSAFPVFFIVAGEWAMTRDHAASRRLCAAVGAEIARADPHRRLRAVHTSGDGREHLKPFAGAPWNDFGDYMQTYDDLHGSILFCRDENRPVVNAEYAYYRREAEDGMVNKANSADADVTRAATWDIAMAGGYVVTGFGTTYFGGHRCRGLFDVDAAKNDDWEAQLGHLRAFFAARDWWKLEPRDELVTTAVPRGRDEGVVGDRQGRPPRVAYWALADPGGREYLVYVRGLNAEGALTLEGAPADATFTMRRFDPRTGAYAPLPPHRGGGTVPLPVPNGQDWVFDVRRTT